MAVGFGSHVRARGFMVVVITSVQNVHIAFLGSWKMVLFPKVYAFCTTAPPGTILAV
jgi:hypothetical protein